MNLNSATREELASHTAEILASQDNRIATLTQERKLLGILLAITLSLYILS